MENQRTKNAIKSSLSGVLARGLGLIGPFVVRTIIIYKLGIDYAGLSSLFSSILQVLSLAELGFASAVSFSMYAPIAEGDTAKVCALLSELKKIYHFIGGIILGAGLAMMPFLRYLINGSYPADINLYILYAIYLFNTFISYYISAYKSSLLMAVQRADIENNILTIVNVLLYVLQIVVLLVFSNYYVYIVFMPISTVVINLLRGALCDKKFPEYKAEGSISKAERKTIFTNIGALAGHRLSGIIVSAVGNVIVSSFLGLTLLGIYGNYYYVINALLAVITIIYSSITGIIGNGIALHDTEKNREEFHVLTFMNVWLVGWIAICLSALYQPFILLWVGQENLLPTTSMLLFVAYFYFWRFKDILSTYKDACGMWKADMWKPYAVVVVSLAISFALINVIGINAVLIGNIVGVFVVSMPWETHVFYKNYFKTGEWKYYLRMFVYTAVVAGVGVANYFLCAILPIGGALGFILKMGICVVFPNLAFVLLSCKTKEFGMIMGKAKQLLKKRMR